MDIWVIQFYITQYNFSICHIELCVGRLDLFLFGRLDLYSLLSIIINGINGTLRSMDKFDEHRYPSILKLI